MDSAKPQGLAGVVVGDTSISTVGKEGKGLTYRGYDIKELAEKSCFTEVAYLLIYNKLPSKDEFDCYNKFLLEEFNIPPQLREILKQIPKYAHPMDVLRTACSALGCVNPEQNQDSRSLASSLIAKMAASLVYWDHYHQGITTDFERFSANSLPELFLNTLLDKENSQDHIKALDVSLILYAEHEFNASTFSARVCVATKNEIYGPLTSAIATLRGPLHGGANEAAMKLIEKFESPDEAAAGLQEMLSAKELVMGFGHRVYTESDPRSEIIKEIARKISLAPEDKNLYAVAESIEKVMWDEKKLFPNLDFYSALVYRKLGFKTDYFTPLFVISRMAGWTAHILEQRDNNRLIRPSANYSGPELLSYEPIENR